MSNFENSKNFSLSKIEFLQFYSEKQKFPKTYYFISNNDVSHFNQ
jgi:hypothetical protein